jgi:cellulose synthase/poly-beta-1,6-N-acetylglucosamine synthase-like glycosyltransferase
MRRVSVIVPCAHAGVITEQLAKALVRQKCVGFPVEVIFAINTAESAVPACFDGKTRVVWERRSGAAAARNAGVRESSGDILAFLDADCIPDPAWLAQGVKTLRRRRGAVIAGRIRRTEKPFNWVSLYDSLTYLQQEFYVRYCRACVTANIITERDTFERIGPFDERFTEAACEDWEWSTRATSKGIQLLYEASAVVLHPHLRNFRQLRSKAERIGRGEAIFSRVNGKRSAGAGLFQSIARQAQRIWRDRRTPAKNKAPLLLLAAVTAVWQWRARMAAARSLRLADDSHTIVEAVNLKADLQNAARKPAI